MQLISADSHVVEPADLWSRELPQRFQDGAPRAERDPDTGFLFFSVPSEDRKTNMTLASAAGLSADEAKELARASQTGIIRPGASAPQPRLDDQDRDGVVAEVLYSTCAFSLFQMHDEALRSACLSVYNDWIADFCRTAPDRLIGNGMVTIDDVDAARAEIRRCADLGLRGVMISAALPEDFGTDPARYDPVWREAADAGVAVSLHVLTGRRQLISGLGAGGFAHALYHELLQTQEIEWSICQLIAAGVFDRVPELRIVSAETGIGYLAHFVQAMDDAFDKRSSRFAHGLRMRPSEYFQQNVYATYISDPVGLRAISPELRHHVMWSSDYPHLASSWPTSRGTVDTELSAAGIPDDDAAALTSGNVVRLYGIALPG